MFFKHHVVAGAATRAGALMHSAVIRQRHAWGAEAKAIVHPLPTISPVPAILQCLPGNGEGPARPSPQGWSIVAMATAPRRCRPTRVRWPSKCRETATAALSRSSSALEHKSFRRTFPWPRGGGSLPRRVGRCSPSAPLQWGLPDQPCAHRSGAGSQPMARRPGTNQALPPCLGGRPENPAHRRAKSHY